MKPRILIVAAALCLSAPAGDHASASEPGWSPVVIARGDYREEIKSIPMEMRPYRPLHFYGNTVRRSYYRGTPMVAPRDLVAPVVVSGTRLFGR